MPIGYTTYCAGLLEDLGNQQVLVTAQEEATPEGTQVLMELELAEPPHPGMLSEVNSELLSGGVLPWAGYRDVAFSDASDSRRVYVAWTKGIAWSGIIIGILLFLLPTILGGILWFLIPQSVKDMLLMMGALMILLPIMGMVVKER